MPLAAVYLGISLSGSSGVFLSEMFSRGVMERIHIAFDSCPRYEETSLFHLQILLTYVPFVFNSGLIVFSLFNRELYMWLVNILGAALLWAIGVLTNELLGITTNDPEYCGPKYTVPDEDSAYLLYLTMCLVFFRFRYPVGPSRMQVVLAAVIVFLAEMSLVGTGAATSDGVASGAILGVVFGSLWMIVILYIIEPRIEYLERLWLLRMLGIQNRMVWAHRD